ncbi:MAG: substrate-binding domain-containing protein [Roseovarius sp.]|nr:substrate-binding domain-containing protein [Roseovarius sp.]
MRASNIRKLSLQVAFAILFPVSGNVFAGDSILLQSTTSTANSGLYDHILPVFTEKTGIAVNVVAVGSGQAIRNARNCDADVLLVHAKREENSFMADGMGMRRYDIMHNDFIIVGPYTDPAGINGLRNAKVAFGKIAKSKSLFVSRSDNSGTHIREMQIWAQTEFDPLPDSGNWYLETGSGMGATLNAGVGMEAYVLTDRATWIGYAGKSDYKVMVEGDPEMFNQYGAILVNPEKCPSVNTRGGRKFVEWLVSAEGQNAIAAHKRGGEQFFIPNSREETRSSPDRQSMRTSLSK